MKEPVTTDPKGENLHEQVNTSALVKKKHSMISAEYITGFIDGEGSFLVSFNRRSKALVGLEVRPSFSVSQHKRNEKILYQIKKYFSCGTVRFDGHDQTYKYEVRSLNDLIRKIIPHFKQTSLQTTKAKDFQKLDEICLLMQIKKHLTQKGLKEILNLAYTMNNLGARKYTKQDLLKIVYKMKV